MYTGVENWNNLIDEPEHWFESKVVIDNVEYGEETIKEMSVQQRMFGGDSPQVGGCLSAEIKLSLYDSGSGIPRMAEIRPYVRVVAEVLVDPEDTSDDPEYETQYSGWMPQGIFFIDTREVTADNDGLSVLTLHGYDGMLRAEADYSRTGMDWPAWVSDVVKEVADFLNVGIDDRTWDVMPNVTDETEDFDCCYKIGLPVGYSYRETLSNIAAMYAGNWVFNYDGELLLVGYGDLPPSYGYLVTNQDMPITFGELVPGDGKETRILV